MHGKKISRKSQVVLNMLEPRTLTPHVRVEQDRVPGLTMWTRLDRVQKF